ncbi:MAG: hypothetical protein R2753_10520 [Chitinophagales bacterium]
MKKIVQLNLLLVAILFAFTACNEDVPDIDNPGVEKRLKSYVFQPPASSQYQKSQSNYEYEDDKLSRINGYTFENGDTVFFDRTDFIYNANFAEAIYQGRELGGDWEIYGKWEFEFDDNNVIVWKEYDYDNNVYEATPHWHIEYSYLSTGQLKSYKVINDERNQLDCEFNSQNILTKALVPDIPTTIFFNDGVKVTGSGEDTLRSSFQSTIGIDIETVIHNGSYIYDSQNKLIQYVDEYIYIDSSVRSDTVFIAIRKDYAQSDYDYNSDGLLISVNNFPQYQDLPNPSAVRSNKYIYESGNGNIQSFWFLLSIGDFNAFDININKAMNKGISTVK